MTLKIQYSHCDFWLTSVFVVLAILGWGNTGWAQGKPLEEKLVSRLNQKQFENAVQTWTEKGFVPLDADVSVLRGRPSFSLKLVKPTTETEWAMRSSLTDGQFKSLNKNAAAKKYRLKCHREYTVKNESLHLCIWHFDENYEPGKETGKSGETPRPKSVPLAPIWNSTTKIPITGEFVPAFANVDKLVANFVRANQVPGLSLAVSFQGRIIYARGFGYSNIESKTTLKPDQPMRFYHVSQPITSAAVMQLADNGQLKLKDPVFEFLGQDISKAVDPNLKKITITHLLHHTAGFDRKTIDPIRNPGDVGKAIGAKTYPITGQQIIDYMIGQSLTSEPGTEFKESSFGYYLLARVIEKASNTKYEDYVLTHIMSPLKIKSMSLGRSLVEDRAINEVSYYGRSGYHIPQIVDERRLNQWVLQADGVAMDLWDGAGGWIGSPSDILLFASDIRATRPKLLSIKAIKTTFAAPPHTAHGTGGKPVTGYFAAGWFVSVTKTRQLSYRYGGHSGAASMLKYEGDGFGWALITNCVGTQSKQHMVNAIHKSGLDRAIIEARKNLGL